MRRPRCAPELYTRWEPELLDRARRAWRARVRYWNLPAEIRAARNRWEYRMERMSPEQRAAYLEKDRARYHRRKEDPEWLKRRRKQGRECHRRRMKNPRLRAKKLARDRARYANDPEFREREKAKARERYHKKKGRQT